MIDFKKLLSQCGKHNNPPFLQDMKFCSLPKDHQGECNFE